MGTKRSGRVGRNRVHFAGGRSGASYTTAWDTTLRSAGGSPHPRGTLAFQRTRRGLLIGTAALGIIAFLAGWRWLGAAAVLPLFYLLPCAAIILMCVRGHGGSTNAPTTPGSNPEPKSDDI